MAEQSIALDTLREAMKQLEAIPPAPFFASMRLLPSDHALRFTRGDREHVGAHPDFWAKIPASDRGMCQSAFAIEIVDLDLPCNRQRKVDFFSAMAAAVTFGPPTTKDQGDNW